MASRVGVSRTSLVAALLLVTLQAAGARGRPAPALVTRSSALHVDAPAPRAPGTDASLAAVARLRGGDTSSILETMKRSYLGITPLTRAWVTVILAFSGLTQVGVLQPEAVQLDAAATMHRLQLWRPLTAASFFGGLGPQLLQKMYYLISFGKELESTLGIGEFARALVSCGAMLSMVFVVLGFPFTGDGLIMAMTVLCCSQNPTAQINMYGLSIPYQFLPLAQLVLSYMFTQQIPWPDIVGLFVGYINYYINDELKPDAAVADSLPKAAGGANKPKGRTLGGGGGSSKSKGGSLNSRLATMKNAAEAADCGPKG